MKRPWSGVGILILAVGSCGCARWTDRQVRRTWTQATQPQDDEPNVAADDGRGGRPARDRSRVPPAEAWDRLDFMLERAVRILSNSPDRARLSQIAHRWCEVPPEAQATEHGAVEVCEPEDQLVLNGHPVILEIGASGVLGWVVQDADDDSSLALLAAARERSANHCLSPFRSATPQSAAEDGRHEEFEICPVEGGSTLAIGRIPNPGQMTWQVSVAIVGAN